MKRTVVILFASVIISACSRNDLNDKPIPLDQLARHSVRVIDSVTNKPIANADVTPIYLSFGGKAYTTNTRGVARVRGLGLPNKEGYGIAVKAQGYADLFLYTGATQDNPDGLIQQDRIEVRLTPVP